MLDTVASYIPPCFSGDDEGSHWRSGRGWNLWLWNCWNILRRSQGQGCILSADIIPVEGEWHDDIRASPEMRVLLIFWSCGDGDEMPKLHQDIESDPSPSSWSPIPWSTAKSRKYHRLRSKKCAGFFWEMQHNFPNVKQIPILIVGNPSLLCQNITRQPQNGHPNSCSASHVFWMRHAVVNYTTTFCVVIFFCNMVLFLILEIVRISGIFFLSGGLLWEVAKMEVTPWTWGILLVAILRNDQAYQCKPLWKLVWRSSSSQRI